MCQHALLSQREGFNYTQALPRAGICFALLSTVLAWAVLIASASGFWGVFFFFLPREAAVGGLGQIRDRLWCWRHLQQVLCPQCCRRRWEPPGILETLRSAPGAAIGCAGAPRASRGSENLARAVVSLFTAGELDQMVFKDPFQLNSMILRALPFIQIYG